MSFALDQTDSVPLPPLLNKHIKALFDELADTSQFCEHEPSDFREQSGDLSFRSKRWQFQTPWQRIWSVITILHSNGQYSGYVGNPIAATAAA